MGLLRWSKGISGFVLVMAALLIVSRACHKSQVSQMIPSLTEGEHGKLIVDLQKKTVTTVTRTGTQENVSVTRGVRGVSAVLGKDGTMQLTLRTKGWTFEPGFGLCLASRPRALIDSQIAFYKEWGLNLGVSTDRNWQVRGLITGSYLVYSNTSIVVGIDSSKDFNIGVRVAL